METKPWVRMAGNMLARLWIVGGTIFFLIRFSAIFYYDNQSAVDGVLSKVRLLWEGNG